jgi:hypothetical protein
MISKDQIYSELKSRGYREVMKKNGDAYEGTNMFFCPQAPELYILYFNNSSICIKKRGTTGYRAALTTKINELKDFDKLDNELDGIILNQDESSFKRKVNNQGCMISFLLLFLFGYTFSQFI